MIGVVVSVFVVSIMSIYWMFYHSLRRTKTKGPQPWFVLNGTLWDLYMFVKRNNIKQGLCHVWIGPQLCMLSVDGPSTEFILKNTKPDKGISKTVPLFPPSTMDLGGSSLVWLNGETYRQHRLLVNSAFNENAYRSYYPKTVQLVDQAIEKIKQNTFVNGAYQKETALFWSSVALDVLSASIFGKEFGMIDGKIDKYYISYKKIIGRSLVDLLIDFLHIPIKNPIRDAAVTLTSFFNQILSTKKASESDNDIITKLAKSSLSDREILSDTFTFFLAGHDTTASTLSWAFVELAKNPDIQEKLYEAVTSRFKPGDPIPFEDLSTLPLLEAFIKENLRLHTPLGVFPTRVADTDLNYEGQIIPKGTTLSVFYYALHRNELYWDDPLKFKLERFLTEDKSRHRYAYIPFSKGIRQCIGNTFSLNEQRLVLIKFLQNYTILPGDLIDGKDIIKTQSGAFFSDRIVAINLRFKPR